jgi:anti-anti-sigma factor
MPEKLEARVRRINNLAIVQLSGDVTTFAEDIVQNAYQEATRDGRHNVAIDFSACEYINSAGIAAIIGVVTEARRQGRRMLVYGLSQHYQKIFRMVGLADYVEMCATEAEVLQRVKPPEK